MEISNAAQVEVQFRARQAYRFGRVIERFDLVSFREVADWLARAPGSVDRNEDRRHQALDDLRRAVSDGEFGPLDKPAIVYMPRVPLRGRRLRVNAVQIELCRAGPNDITADLWAPRAFVARWFASYRLDPPPWLGQPSVISAVPAHRGGRPAKVPAVLTAWFAQQTPDQLRAGKLAERFVADNPTICKVDYARKMIAKLRSVKTGEN